MEPSNDSRLSVNVKQIIIIRKDLNMRKGKIASQAAHASLGAIMKCMKKYISTPDMFSRTPDRIHREMHYPPDSSMAAWLDGTFTKICVYVNSEQELLDIRDKAVGEKILHCLIQDSGATEFHGVPTYTALALGPDWHFNLDHITGQLPLL